MLDCLDSVFSNALTIGLLLIWYSILFVWVPFLLFPMLRSQSKVKPNKPPPASSPSYPYRRRRRRRVHPLVRRGLRLPRSVLLRCLAKAAASPTWAADLNTAGGFCPLHPDEQAASLRDDVARSAKSAPVPSAPSSTEPVDALLLRLDPLDWFRRVSRVQDLCVASSHARPQSVSLFASASLSSASLWMSLS